MEAPVFAKNEGDRSLYDRWLPAIERETRRPRRLDEFVSRLGRARSEKDAREKRLLHERLEERRARLKTANESLHAAEVQTSELLSRIDDLRSELTNLEQERPKLELLRADFIAEVTSKYTSFMIAKDYFKSKLNMYYTVDESSPDYAEITIEFFTTKRMKTLNNSIVLHQKADTFRLIRMNPELAVFKELVQRLEETNDVVGLLACVRILFYNTNKK